MAWQDLRPIHPDCPTPLWGWRWSSVRCRRWSSIRRWSPLAHFTTSGNARGRHVEL